MRHVLGLLVASVGLAVAAYGLASLTGGWLGTPPWWEVEQRLWLNRDGHARLAPRLYTPRAPREGREAISGSLVAVGFAAAVVGLASAWPRRAKAREA